MPSSIFLGTQCKPCAKASSVPANAGLVLIDYQCSTTWIAGHWRGEWECGEAGRRNFRAEGGGEWAGRRSAKSRERGWR